MALETTPRYHSSEADALARVSSAVGSRSDGRRDDSRRAGDLRARRGSVSGTPRGPAGRVGRRRSAGPAGVERRVAELAATGLGSRQIADRFSPEDRRNVLGLGAESSEIHSRAELGASVPRRAVAHLKRGEDSDGIRAATRLQVKESRPSTPVVGRRCWTHPRPRLSRHSSSNGAGRILTCPFAALPRLDAAAGP